MDVKNAIKSEIQDLFYKFEKLINKTCLEYQMNPEHFNFRDPKIKKTMESLFEKIDKLASLETDGSEEQRRILVTKPLILYLEEQILFEGKNITLDELLVHAKKLETWSKPFRLEPMGVRAYFWSWVQKSTCHNYKGNYQLSIEAGKTAESIYHEYKAKNPNVKEWSNEKIFKSLGVFHSPAMFMLNRSLDHMMKWVANNLFVSYFELKQTENQVIYAMDYVKYPLISVSFRVDVDMIDRIVKAAWVLFNKARRMRQLNHLLAGAMNLSCQLRRSLPQERKSEMNVPQARLSNAFFLWGYFIANESMKRIKHGKSDEKIDNESYEELKIFKQDGYDTYSGQFPIELVDTEAEVSKIFKKSLKWFKRASVLWKGKIQCNCISDGQKLIDEFTTKYPELS